MFHSRITQFLLLFCVASFCLFPAPVRAAEKISDVEFWLDVKKDAVWSDLPAKNFQPLPQDEISLGITTDVYWLRFKPPSQSSYSSLILQIDNPNLDFIDVYLPTQGSYKQHLLGNERPLANREIFSATPSFHMSAEEEGFIYLRVASTSALRLPIKIWSESDFWHHLNLHYLGFGLFYGLLLTTSTFYLFIFRALKDPTYLYYSLYTLGMMFYQSQVHGHIRLFFNLPQNIFNSIFWLSLSATFLFSLHFAALFLHLNKSDRSTQLCLRFLAALALLQGFCGAAGYNIFANQLAHLLGIIGPLTMIALAVQRLRQGFKAARFFLAAWLILISGIFLWIISAYLSVPVWAANLILPATAGEILLLAVALADRLKLLQDKQQKNTSRLLHYQRLSLTDELTGLFNKRHFLERLPQSILDARKQSAALSILIFDLDHFKNYNDTHGHWEGDCVLAALGTLLQGLLPEDGSAFRYGGEEFIILLPNTGQAQALQVAQQIRDKFAAQIFYPSGVGVKLTLSAGAAQLKENESAAFFFKRADAALYKAKDAGRNCIISA